MSSEKTERLQLRFSPEEKEMLTQKASEARMTLSDYISSLIENKKIIVVENIPQLYLEITRIGVNINQIAHVANSQKYVNTQQIYEVKNLLREVEKNMEKIINALDNYDEDDVRTFYKKMLVMEQSMSAMERRMSMLERNFDEAFYHVNEKLDRLVSSAQKRVDNNGNS